MLASTSCSRFALLCVMRWSVAESCLPWTVPKSSSVLARVQTADCCETGVRFRPSVDTGLWRAWAVANRGQSLATARPWTELRSLAKISTLVLPRCLFEVPSIKTSTTSVAERCRAAPERTVIVWSNKGDWSNHNRNLIYNVTFKQRLYSIACCLWYRELSMMPFREASLSYRTMGVLNLVLSVNEITLWWQLTGRIDSSITDKLFASSRCDPPTPPTHTHTHMIPCDAQVCIRERSYGRWNYRQDGGDP